MMKNQSDLPPYLSALLAANKIIRGGKSPCSEIALNNHINQDLGYHVKRWLTQKTIIVPTEDRMHLAQKLNDLYVAALKVYKEIPDDKNTWFLPEVQAEKLRYSYIRCATWLLGTYYDLLLIEPLIPDFTRLIKKPSDIILGWSYSGNTDSELEEWLLKLYGKVAGKEWSYERIYTFDFYCEDVPRQIRFELEDLS